MYILKLYFSFTDIQEVKIQGRGATIQKYAIEQEEPIYGWLRTDTMEILQNELFADDRIDDHTRLTFVRSNIFDYHINTIPHLEFPYHYTVIGTHYLKIRLYLQQGEASQEIDKRFFAFIEPLKIIRNNL